MRGVCWSANCSDAPLTSRLQLLLSKDILCLTVTGGPPESSAVELFDVCCL